MILEVFKYLTEKPKIKEAKTFSHLFESIALFEKQKRCKKFWLSHQKSCHKSILELIEHSVHFDSLLVLGSGHIQEIPLEALAQKFKRITLVDIVHLNAIKKKFSHLRNVEFIEHEITEVEALVAQGIYQNKIPQAFTNQNWGMVISLNLMSQLPLHIENFLEKKDPLLLGKVEIRDFLQNVTRDHLIYLKELSKRSILITDVEILLKDKQGLILDKSKNYPHLKLPKAHAIWSWINTPLSENRNAYITEMEVQSFLIRSCDV